VIFILTQQISDDMRNLLLQQMSNELYNSQFYKKIGAYLKVKGLDNIGDFFLGEADGEVGHQKIILSYLLDRNIPVEMLVVPAVTETFSTLIDIGTLYVNRERDTTQHIKNIVSLALESDDFLTFQYFNETLIKEQIEEESISMTFLDKVTILGDNQSMWVLFDKDFELK